MDWNKAKTILIIGFIIIDIFLFTQVYDIGPGSGNDSSTVVQVLEEQGIKVEAVIPEQLLSLPLLEVEYEIFDGESMDLAKFLGDGFYEVKIDEHYRNDGNESIQIKDGKKLVYQHRKTEADYGLESQKAYEYVANFIIDNSMDLANYGETSAIISNGVYSITYHEMYGQYSLENSYIRFIVDGNGVAGFEKQKITSVRESQGILTMTSGEEALLRLLKHEDIVGNTLKEIKICYYDDEAGEDWENIVKDTVDPTWKAVFEGGIIKYLIETE